MNEHEERPDAPTPYTDEEREKILLAAKEAKTTIIAVAAVAIGSMIVMFLITLVIVALKLL